MSHLQCLLIPKVQWVLLFLFIIATLLLQFQFIKNSIVMCGQPDPTFQGSWTLKHNLSQNNSVQSFWQLNVDVACGKHEAASGMTSGKGYVDVSTVDGDTSKLINSHKSTGALFLEAPVSGSKKPAEDGQLIFLTAGDKSLYETAGPLLDIMGKSRFYLGEVGNGATMKLIVNMIMGSMMASFSKGLLLSENVGLDPSVLVQVISQGAINAPMYATKGPSMVQSLYPTAFPLKHQQKV